jgi:hypothetical protein
MELLRVERFATLADGAECIGVFGLVWRNRDLNRLVT